MAEMTLEGVDARPEDSAFALGRVHSIETMGTVDGPGIRFVVFVQGCPMRCRYCHNPDTWRTEGGTLMDASEILDRAEGFRSYWGPEGGITVSGGEALMQAEFVAELFEQAHEREQRDDDAGHYPAERIGQRGEQILFAHVQHGGHDGEHDEVDAQRDEHGGKAVPPALAHDEHG